MKKNGFFMGVLVAVVIFIAFFGNLLLSNIMKKNVVKLSTVNMEVGMKISDLKWLSRLGVIPEKDYKEVEDKLSKGVDIEELNELLNSKLGDKESEFLEEVMQSVLSDD